MYYYYAQCIILVWCVYIQLYEWRLRTRNLRDNAVYDIHYRYY